MKRILLAASVLAAILAPATLAKPHHRPPRHHHRARLSFKVIDWLVVYDAYGHVVRTHVPLGGSASTCSNTNSAYFVGLEYRWSGAKVGTSYTASLTGPSFPRDDLAFRFPSARGSVRGSAVLGINSHAQSRSFAQGLLDGTYAETFKLGRKRLGSSRVTIATHC